MVYYLAVFKSRTQSMKFYEILQRANLSCSVVNTPREASVGCGLSVRFDPGDFARVRRLYQLHSSPSFSGFYQVVRRGGSGVVTKI